MKAEQRSLKRARILRRSLTLPEIILWDQLRKKRQGEARFRRQHPLGPYVLDFYCDQARLAVEVDGQVHDMGDNPSRDARRDAWLARQGVTTLRILATDVLNNLEGVLYEINAAVREGISRIEFFLIRGKYQRSGGRGLRSEPPPPPLRGPPPPEGEDLERINLPP
jgi:very-short-patch-repair endonuclease